MVGATGFEPVTSWSRTLGRPILQAIAWLCNLPIPCSFRHFLNHFQTFRLAQGCTELSPLVTRKGQEKGKLTQVLDSRFTHHYRPPASHCDRTSQVRRRAWTSDQERLVFSSSVDNALAGSVVFSVPIGVTSRASHSRN